jgi:hypothetical protein
MKPNPKEINILLNILQGAEFEFLPRAPFYIDTPLSTRYYIITMYVFLMRSKHVYERPNDADSERHLVLANYKLITCPCTLQYVTRFRVYS